MKSEPFIEKMRAADVPELAIRIFTHYYQKLVEGGSCGPVHCKERR